MDNTLIATASGRVFPLDHNDWKIFLSEVPGKLKSYHEDGYKIVVITNQAGVAKGKVKIEDFQTKVERIAEKIGVPMQLWAITSKRRKMRMLNYSKSVDFFCNTSGEGIFRKPRIGMWNCLRDQKNEGVPINMEQSFYCGDAAGRNKDWLPGGNQSPIFSLHF